MLGARQAECPNCGAPIVWQLASSQAAVCKYCHFSVVRTDRELTAIGRVADLVPTAAALAVGDEASADERRLRVLGRIQLDHGRGPWDEWYVADGERWGWLAQAEGRWYLTFERAEASLPAWEQVALGAELTIAGVRWVVTERGGSAVLSAEGELPYAVDPHGSGRYADLEGPDGAFATLDFGEPSRLFVGSELGDVALVRAALGPRPVEKVAVAKLACPSCGARIELRIATSERVGCVHCGALLDHTQGTLSLFSQFERPRLKPLIPLGSQGSLLGEERTVIGFMQRYVVVDGDRYTFREYLLHGASGYSWLIEEDHHWLFAAPVSTSSVKSDGSHAYYRHTSYRAYAKGAPAVDFVLGEFYWKVMAGDRSETFDYIAPPRLLSFEKSETEITWSEGEYVEPGTLIEAFGLRELPSPNGVAPAQPNPHRKWRASLSFVLLAVLWSLLAFAYECGHPQSYRYDGLVLQGASPSNLPNQVLLTEPFLVPRGPTTLAVEASAPIDNGSVYVEASLIPEQPAGEPRVLPIAIEYYHGVEGGEGWSEGSQSTTEYYGSVAAGRYSLRFVGSWEPYPPALGQELVPPVTLRVTVGARDPGCSIATLFLLALPWLLTFSRYAFFEARRKQNESLE